MAKAEMVGQDWRQEAARRYKEKMSKGRFKLAQGMNTIRVLPRVGSKEDNSPFMEYQVHREVGPNKRFVRCGHDAHDGGECWLCDEKIPALLASDNPAKRKMGAALQPKEQFVVQIAVVDQDTGKMTGPVLWTVPTGGSRALSTRLLGVLKSPKRDYIDPEDGYNLSIERTGSGRLDTVYGQIEPDDEPSAVPDKILAATKPFDKYVPAYSEEQQKAAYFGRDEHEAESRAAEEEEEEEEPRKKPKRALDEDDEYDRPHKKPRHDEEDEEEDEAPKKKPKKPAEDEDEDEAPKKKPKKPVDEDDDADAEAEPDEDEDDTPPKKKPRLAEEEDEDEVPRKKPKKPAEDEDEEEDNEPKKPRKKPVEEDEEEEDERPRKKPKKPAADDDDE
jgi:hypothetical protein